MYVAKRRELQQLEASLRTDQPILIRQQDTTVPLVVTQLKLQVKDVRNNLSV